MHQSQYPAFLSTVERSASWVHFALALDTLSTWALVVRHAHVAQPLVIIQCAASMRRDIELASRLFVCCAANRALDTGNTGPCHMHCANNLNWSGNAIKTQQTRKFTLSAQWNNQFLFDEKQRIPGLYDVTATPSASKWNQRTRLIWANLERKICSTRCNYEKFLIVTGRRVRFDHKPTRKNGALRRRASFRAVCSHCFGRSTNEHLTSRC